MKKIVKIMFLLMVYIIIQLSHNNINAVEKVYVNGYSVKSYTENINYLKGINDLKAGEINVGKSVLYNNDGSFNINLGAIGKSFETIDTPEYNIVLVIDNSASMYNTEKRIQSTVDAINSIIREASDNENINIGVVSYSSNTYHSINQEPAMPILNLGHYTSNSDSDVYIEYVKDVDGKETWSDEFCKSRYIHSVTTQNDCDIQKKHYAGYTHTQAGVIAAYEMLESANNKDTAIPVVILMSDGEANCLAYSKGTYSSDKEKVKNYQYQVDSISSLINDYSIFYNESWKTLGSASGYTTIRECMYIKDKINEIYKNKCAFYTFGYYISDSSYVAKAVLNPTKENIDMLENYMSNGYNEFGIHYLVYNSGISWKDLCYTNQYYSNNGSDNIGDIFKQIIFEEVNKRSPLRDGDNLVIEDKVGEGFELLKEENKIPMMLNIDSEDVNIELVTNNGIVYEYQNAVLKISYNSEDNSIIVKIDGSYFIDKFVSLSFDIKLSENSIGTLNGKTYYTNEMSKYNFSTNEKNPYYKGATISQNLDISGSITLQKEPAKVIVNYIDNSTGELIEKSEIIDGWINDEYSTHQKQIEGYKLINLPENANGKFLNKETIVTYKYIKQSSVTVKYVDIDTNNEISPQNVTIYNEGEEYSTQKKDIENYQYLKSTSNVSGIVGRNNIEVIYYYEKKNGTLIVKYVDEDGNILLKEESEGKIGEEYRIEEKVINGYKVIKRPESCEGKYRDGVIELVFILKQDSLKKGTIEINFVDVNGNILLEKYIEIDEIGKEFYIEAPEIDGYKVIGDDKISAIYVDGKLVFNVVYDKILNESIVPTSDIEFIKIIIIGVICFTLMCVITNKLCQNKYE